MRIVRIRLLLPLLLLLTANYIHRTHAWKSKLNSIITKHLRHQVTIGTSIALAISQVHILTLHPSPIFARNLPPSNGASAINRGQPLSLVPILNIQNTIEQASQHTNDLIACAKLLHQIPTKEKEFKKLFDEHSEGISYKQVFMDQNGFLVYYT